MNVVASMGIVCIYCTSQADGHSFRLLSLLPNTVCCFLVAAFVLPRTLILQLCSIGSNKSTLALRVYNCPLLAFLHIDVTISHLIAGVEQAANHSDWSLLQL